MEDNPMSMWATDGEGVSSWIEVKFKNKYQISKVEYKNREEPS